MENICKKGPSAVFINNKRVINFSYKWVINNFDASFSSAKSPVFSNGTNKGIWWYMRIDSKPDAASSPSRDQSADASVEDIIYCVQLFLVPIGETKLLADCDVKLLSVQPENTYSCKKSLRFSPGMSLDCFEINKREIINSENGFLQNGKITLTCDIKTAINIAVPRLQQTSFLSRDMERFFENPAKYSDVTICVSGREFQAHKAILAARSPVFTAMFEHEMKELQENRVNIPDIDEEVFQELLRYIYTGQVFNLDDFAIDLLPAADKYKMPCLKALCVEELCTNMAIENAAEVLVLADLHQVEQLKDLAISCIGTHAEDVCKTEGWKSLIQSYPHLITEVLCAVSKQH